MVQAWYQGGFSVWDFTDSRQPREIGYFDRPAAAPTRRRRHWSSYYYNGHVYSTDLGKGFDVLQITDPSLTRRRTVKMDKLNVQSQPVYKVK